MTDRWVELRVHGVSGTSAEAFLGCTPEQVHGDDKSQFFQCLGADPAGGWRVTVRLPAGALGT